ncbi:alpha/beta fold hydrolase [Pelagibaculum spongiae]|uniref:Alpha/beta hydrolase n=1 Tax=Pelagibaculum spongiae TaxID=2080658 RepID=A0A2V1GZB2_9GAMM|nr:alpha/beta hydrolase [Pelagibaculum spongiae]PVZ72086.1 alpha/beta hydrolase [Pelagibaculum spongiae]
MSQPQSVAETPASGFLDRGIAALGVQNIPVQQIIEKYATTETGSLFVEVAGVNVHYRDQGEGTVILLLHGILDSLHTWDYWVEAFGKGYRLVRLDYPGFGLTGGWADGEYSKERWLDFFGQFLEKIGVTEPIHIAGNSLGGGFAWQMAVNKPEKVKSIIMLDPVGYSETGTPWPITMASLPIAGSIMRLSTPPILFRFGIGQLFGDKNKIKPWHVQRYIDLSARQGNRSSYVDAFRYLTKMMKHQKEMLKKIPEIKIPVQLQWGDKDPWFLASIEIDMWKKDLPDLDLVVFQGVGHVPQLEVPELSAQSARRFIESQQ